MKEKLTDLAKKLGITWDEAQRLRDTKLKPDQWAGKGKNTWLTEEAVRMIALAVQVPPVVPDVLYGEVIMAAPNPNLVMVKLEGDYRKTPVFIPRRLHGRLIGKRIPIHAITDATGTTYRHAQLTGPY